MGVSLVAKTNSYQCNLLGKLSLLAKSLIAWFNPPQERKNNLDILEIIVVM
jgi:hypothetical protein